MELGSVANTSNPAHNYGNYATYHYVSKMNLNTITQNSRHKYLNKTIFDLLKYIKQ